MATALHASIDGEQQAPDAARISILDDGLLRGDGAFEAIKLYEGHPFRLGAHLERLGRSAAALALDYEAPALEREIAELLAAVEPGDGALRVVLTRGGRRILLVEELPSWPASARVATVPLSPSEVLAGVKSISYAGNMHATRIAAERGADEAVFVDRDGTVLEAPTASVFWATPEGVLQTPALETGILDSITRRVVVEALPCEEGAFGADRLRAAAEAFLASTTREIQPISAVDDSELALPSGGPLVERARLALAQAVDAERRSGG